MRYKDDKNIKFVVTTFVFSSSKCTQIRFWQRLRPDPAGELTTLPRPPSRLGRGIPLPIPLSARRLRRLGYEAPSTQNPVYASALSRC